MTALSSSFLDEFFPCLDKGTAAAEEHALRDDDAGGAAGLQQGEDALGKEQLGLGGVELEAFVDVALVDAAGEGRIGHDDVVVALLGEALAEGVLVIDMGIVDAVHHEIHEGEADHGAVEVEAVQALLQNVFVVLRELAADAGADEAVFVGLEFLALPGLFHRQLGDNVLVGIKEEFCGAAGGIADAVAELGIYEFADELDDVARGAELTVFSGAADFIEQHFIDIALDVLMQVAGLAGIAPDLDEDVLDDLDGTLQEVGAWDDEDGIGHVPGEGAAVAVEVFDEGEDPLLDVGEHVRGRQLFGVTPAEGGLVDGEAL